MPARWWRQGRSDLGGVIDAPGEETAAAIGWRVGAAGAAPAEMRRAFDAEEMGRILTKVGCMRGGRGNEVGISTRCPAPPWAAANHAAHRVGVAPLVQLAGSRAACSTVLIASTTTPGSD
jgi:hypothetical protein